MKDYLTATVLISTTVVVGIGVQVIARYLQIPSIIFLLVFGVVLGASGLGWLEPSLLGSGLVPVERADEKIAVEIKTFLGDSPITDYHAALGQFLNYRLALELSEPDRTLYLAIPVAVDQAFFQREFAQLSVERYQIKRVIYNPVQEVIVQLIN